MPVDKLSIKSKIYNYSVHFEQTEKFLNELSCLKHAFFLIDRRVWDLYENQELKGLINADKMLISIDESVKNLEMVKDIYDAVINRSPKRNLNVVSIGGGILQDLSGFFASTLYRGVNWVYVPTTLLAQTDSCIGAKTSLNYRHYKNLIGTFYPPSNVYVYPYFLKTLDDLDYFSGIGELAKLHIMGGESDAQQFCKKLDKLVEKDQQILLELIQRALIIKKEFIEDDEFDAGRRNFLNYGHCFGHAIESATDFQIPHGQAVVLGMLLANIYAVKKNLLSADLGIFLRNEILLPILKVDRKSLRGLGPKIVEAMTKDKKNVGSGLALIVFAQYGTMKKVADFTSEEALDTIDHFLDE